MKTIDLNCDLGEWKDDNGALKDAEIMPYISSCNIACGGHIGDQKSMISTIRLALKHNVAVGAHPSYPDKENFGRKVLELSDEDLKKSLIDQLSQFRSLLVEEGAVLHHIKPHGALYNEASVNKTVANVIISAIKEVEQNVPVYCQEGSELDKAIVAAGFTPVYEVFADRAYEDDLTLRSRNLDGAIIHDSNMVFEHIYRMVLEGKVKTYTGLIKQISAETICLHSDTRGSINLAREINFYLNSKGVKIAAA
jgi:UPF0271 protein